VGEKEQDGVMVVVACVVGVVGCVLGVVVPFSWCVVAGDGVKTCVCEVV